MVKELETINIAVVAPTGAGKTALISTVCDYIKANSNKAKGYTLEIENSAAQELNGFTKAVSAQLAGQNMSFKSALIKPTKECQEYEFSMNFTDKTTGLAIKQPFKIMDIPGAFINNRLDYENDSEYQRFINHLDTSRILWIPVDTPILMECETPDEKSLSDEIRCTTNLKDFCVEWAQFAAENKQLDFCNFVLLKCEKYFSHDSQNAYNGCKKRFDDSYGDIIDAMKSQNKEDKFACIAVETIGSAKANTVRWTSNNLEVEYIATGLHRKIQGADCLLHDAMRVAINNVNSEIDIQKAAKEDEKSEYKSALKEIINEQKRRIREMQAREQRLTDETDKLRSFENQVKDAPWWEKLMDTFGFGSLPELREKIRNLQAHRNSLREEIQSAQDKLSELQDDAETTRENISVVNQEIEALNKITTWFANMSQNNANPKYYRSL